MWLGANYNGSETSILIMYKNFCGMPFYYNLERLSLRLIKFFSCFHYIYIFV
jgi:hypothetical protein